MKDFAKLVVYARDDLSAGAELDRYRPVIETVNQVARLLPSAHVEIVSASWCKDCRREVPRFVRIVEQLTGWTVDLLGDDQETRRRLGVEKIPTFVIRHPETGRELGRIVESPRTDSLESDLLAIAEAHPSQILA